METKRFVSSMWVVVCLLSPAPLWAADNDGDGVDDAVDVCCETPPDIEVDEEGRPVGDLDRDCDVDLDDFSGFQNSVTGPLTAGCCSDDECDDVDSCTEDSCAVDTGTCLFTPVVNCGVSCDVGGACPVELTCDVPVAGAISSATETDSLCLCVFEGDRLRIAVSESAGSGANFNPNWRLLDAAGDPAPTCGLFTTTVAVDCGPLTAAGNPYRLEVEDGARNDVGSYSAYFHRLPATVACEGA